MQSKKLFLLGFVVLLLLTATILSSCKEINVHPTKPSLDFIELMENENIYDISLTIYCVSLSIFTQFPWDVDDLINSGIAEKIVINGNDLEDHIELFKQISNDDFISVNKKSSYVDARLYYVLESKKNGKLFDVIMWGGGGDANNIFVNGFEVKENDIFYNVIMPFLPGDITKELETFTTKLKQ